MTITINELQAQHKCYNIGRDNEELASRNREAFETVLKALDLAENSEAPLNTVLMMYPNFDDLKHNMCHDELEFRLTLLKRAGFISVRQGVFSTQMVSTTDYGNKRYAA
ncbi:hypothetical protein ASD24_24610 [Paenibacillus sp. Root52]|uniref:hypothetical protein n=1 Tax=Paenibacillus sp. Root52 TaxID=1736552 RepID=UPI0006FA2060|nr:hypothetical protein [Paenibacillus sp. Root52]KQY90981.1 hypothetical protein ASD24_24610 [Paenibacillus sp. Root52]